MDRAILLSFPVFGFFTVTLVIVTGIAIYSAYAECDPLTSGQIAKSDQIVPYFVVKELAYIPGMLGLFAAVIFSAVLSTISSTLNSLAAVTWEDFLVKISFFRNMGDSAQSLTYKILSVTYAVIIVVLAFYAEHLGSIFQAAITVVSTAVSIQGSVFLMGVFMAFVNKIGAIMGMIVGIILMGFLSVNSFILQKKYSFQPKLNFTTTGCSEDIWDSFNKTSSSTLLPASELEFPTKFYTVSYILYPLIGSIITITVAIVVSLLTGGRKQGLLVKPEYLHPLVRPKKLSTYENNNAEKINMGFNPDPETQECRL